MGSARDFLKKMTSESHRALDASPLVAGLATGKLKISNYAGMLHAYLDFFDPWEKGMIDQHPRIVKTLGSIRFNKSQWLREDLAKLATNCSVSTGPGFPISVEIAELAGCLYVIEGSTLGGMHLSRSSAGLPGGANRFFQSYGAETMAQWSAFIAWLESTLVDEESQQRAARTAIAVFSDFQRRFDQVAERIENESGLESKF
jgi:heme oxygenase (biliverdin-IX-beta and delta-forming)